MGIQLKAIHQVIEQNKWINIIIIQLFNKWMHESNGIG